jgi:hypothetical protein
MRMHGALATVLGVRVLNATALLAAIGDGQLLARGRALGRGLDWCHARSLRAASRAWSASPNVATKYLHKLLIDGARSALPWLATSATLLGRWLRALMQRVYKNAALANKLARIVWDVRACRKEAASTVPWTRTWAPPSSISVLPRAGHLWFLSSSRPPPAQHRSPTAPGWTASGQRAFRRSAVARKFARRSHHASAPVAPCPQQNRGSPRVAGEHQQYWRLAQNSRPGSVPSIPRPNVDVAPRR